MNVDRPLLPIACTLDARDGAARLEEWRRIIEAHGRGRERKSGRITLAFDLDAALRLQQLVDAERDCCAFVHWELRTTIDVVSIVISGSDDSLGALTFV